MGWWNTGVEDAEKHAWEHADGGGGTRRFWLPPDTTNRIMFLDDDPPTLWEHQMKIKGDWKNWEPCKVRNRLDDECAICDRYGDDRKPSYVGFFSIINMTPWTSRGGAKFCYGRELYVPKLGGKDKPGVLKKLGRMKKQYGRLRGLVFDVYRAGSKTESVGDDFQLIEKVDPKDIVAYGRKKVAEFLEEINRHLAPDKQLTLDKLLSRSPWEPFDYEELLSNLRSNEELERMLGGGSDSSPPSGFDDDTNDTSDNGGGGGYGGGGQGDFADDDIPF